MYGRRKKNSSSRMGFIFVANCALFFFSLTVSTAAILVTLHPSSTANRMSEETLLQVENKVSQELEKEYSDRLLEAEQTLTEKNKLMLGASSLSGGRVSINFADRRELISVGERIDFRFEDCDCFLLMKSSTFGSASFRYACTPSTI